MRKIGFNKPYLTGKEYSYIADAVGSLKLSGNGKYTQLCQSFFEKRYGFGKCLLTTSCTDALEMAAILLNIQPGDEVILPSYTFVSTVNAFLLRGAKIVFIDSMKSNPNLDADLLEGLVTKNTKAIVPVHYAGVSCDMDMIMKIARKYDLFVVEDAAQAIDSYWVDKDGSQKPLGSFGHLSAFSFHETKNIISGEGGMLVINDKRFEKRAEIIWEKGTNRSAFFRGEVDKYNWMDIGSSFLPSDMIAAFLYAQLEMIDVIQKKRLSIWSCYWNGLSSLKDGGKIGLPNIPDHATNNAHMFYITVNSGLKRDNLIASLRQKGVYAIFHYLSLHKSPFYLSGADSQLVPLPNSEFYTEALVRLPMYFDLSVDDVEYVVEAISESLS
jgi:dTDP-4-amino-4,6-dideoxygalactose transaminase